MSNSPGASSLPSIIISLTLCGVVIALKWITMGRYEPTMKPMWSWWAMRTEAVAVIYAGLAGRMLLEHLRGTPFLPWVWRLLGAKIGRGVFVDMTDITEFDCVSVGDFSALNANAALQTHLYEDRVMKVGRVKVGKGVTVGAGSTVLYDTRRLRLCAAWPAHRGDEGRADPAAFGMGRLAGAAEGARRGGRGEGESCGVSAHAPLMRGLDPRIQARRFERSHKSQHRCLDGRVQARP